jgi:magnesium chelatase accessory protein
MARALGLLSRAVGPSPEVVVGHSAGAVILGKLCVDGMIAPRLLASLNGAWLPFDGLAGQLFPPMAKLLFLNPLAPRLFAWSADRKATSRLLRGTGSTIDPRGVDLYARLFANPGHVAGALAMMANWDLERFKREWPKLTTRVALIVADDDKAVPAKCGDILAAALPNATAHHLRGLGHLAHEEQPAKIVALIEELADAS